MDHLSTVMGAHFWTQIVFCVRLACALLAEDIVDDAEFDEIVLMLTEMVFAYAWTHRSETYSDWQGVRFADLNDYECQAWFRFSKEEIEELTEQLHLLSCYHHAKPLQIHQARCSHCSALETVLRKQVVFWSCMVWTLSRISF